MKPRGFQRSEISTSKDISTPASCNDVNSVLHDSLTQDVRLVHNLVNEKVGAQFCDRNEYEIKDGDDCVLL